MGALDNKVAVITGSGRGIGRGMALLFAQEGARVVVNDPGVSTDGSGHDAGPADHVAAEIKAAGGNAVANYDSVATVDGGATITPAAPSPITLSASSRIGAKPGAETPATTGTRPSTRASTRLTILRDSSAVSFGASPIMPSTVSPVAPFSR